MRLLTDDLRAGIQLTKDAGPFWRLRLILDGGEIGDFEPAIPWSAVVAFTRLPELRDHWADPGSNSPAELLAALSADAHLHDRCLGGQAETFDGWSIYHYRFDDRAVFITAQWMADGVRGEARTTTTPWDSWIEIADLAVRHYEVTMNST